MVPTIVSAAQARDGCQHQAVLRQVEIRGPIECL